LSVVGVSSDIAACNWLCSVSQMQRPVKTFVCVISCNFVVANFTFHYSLFTIHCSLFTIHYSLFFRFPAVPASPIRRPFRVGSDRPPFHRGR